MEDEREIGCGRVWTRLWMEDLRGVWTGGVDERRREHGCGRVWARVWMEDLKGSETGCGLDVDGGERYANIEVQICHKE